MSKKQQKKKLAPIIALIVIVAIIIGLALIYFNTDQIQPEVNNPNVPENFASEIQDILTLQKEKGPDAILEIDCNTLVELESQEYCQAQHLIMKK